MTSTRSSNSIIGEAKSWFFAAGALMTGSVLAQLVSFAATPILTRLYTAEVFGLFGVFVGAVALMSSLFSWRLELAVSIPSSDREGAEISSTVRGIAYLTTVLLVGVVYLTEGSVTPGRLSSDSIYLSIFASLIVAVNASMAQLNLRHLMFSLQAKLRVLQSIMNAGFAVMFAILGVVNVGLMLATITSQIFIGLLLYRHRHNSDSSFISSFTVTKKVVCRYWRFPVLQMPSTIIETLGVYLPVIYLEAFYGSKAAGFFFLTQTVLRAPIQFISTAIGEAYRQWLSRALGTNLAVFKPSMKVASTLSLSAVVIFGLVALLAQNFATIFFGDSWGGVENYIYLFCIMCFFQFISSPLSVVFYVLEKQRLDLVVQALTTGLLALSMLVLTPHDALAFTCIYVLIYSTKHILQAIFALKYLRAYD